MTGRSEDREINACLTGRLLTISAPVTENMYRTNMTNWYENMTN
jgi:hypothetical protein